MDSFIEIKDQPLFLVSPDQGRIDCLTEFINFKKGKVIGSFVGVCNEKLDDKVIVLVFEGYTKKEKKQTGYNGDCVCFSDDMLYKLIQKYLDYKHSQMESFKTELKYPYKLEFSKVEGDKVIYELRFGKPKYENRLVITSNKNNGHFQINYDKSDIIPCYYVDKDNCDMAQFLYSDLSRKDIDNLKKFDRDYLRENAEVVIPLITEIKKLKNIL